MNQNCEAQNSREFSKFRCLKMFVFTVETCRVLLSIITIVGKDIDELTKCLSLHKYGFLMYDYPYLDSWLSPRLMSSERSICVHVPFSISLPQQNLSPCLEASFKPCTQNVLDLSISKLMHHFTIDTVSVAEASCVKYKRISFTVRGTNTHNHVFLL